MTSFRLPLVRQKAIRRISAAAGCQTNTSTRSTPRQLPIFTILRLTRSRSAGVDGTIVTASTHEDQPRRIHGCIACVRHRRCRRRIPGFASHRHPLPERAGSLMTDQRLLIAVYHRAGKSAFQRRLTQSIELPDRRLERPLYPSERPEHRDEVIAKDSCRQASRRGFREMAGKLPWYAAARGGHQPISSQGESVALRTIRPRSSPPSGRPRNRRRCWSASFGAGLNVARLNFSHGDFTEPRRSDRPHPRRGKGHRSARRHHGRPARPQDARRQRSSRNRSNCAPARASR